MDAFLVGRVARVGLDEEAFVPYLVGLLEEDDEAGDVRQRLTAALENAGAENFGSFVEETLQWRQARAEGLRAEEERRKREALEAAEKALLASKVLRGDRTNGAGAGQAEETSEERKRRLELLARYDVPDEVVMGENGQVIFRDTSEKAAAGPGGDANDNAERVRLAELEKREKQKQESQKQKELSKTSAYDGKKKKEEAKEKRRQKAVKVERKRN